MRLLITSVTALLLITGNAHAGGRGNIKEIAQELGISKRDMVSCVRGSGGKPDGEMSDEQRKSFMSAMYSCVSAKNPDLTQDQFKETMLKMKK